MKIVALSDLHGCMKPLAEALKLYSPDEYKYIFLGDMIDRGKQNKQVIETILSIKNRITLYGNHELMLADYLSQDDDGMWLYNGGSTTLAEYCDYDGSYENAKQALIGDKNLMQYLAALKSYEMIDNMMFVHAGINPRKSLEENSLKDLVWVRDIFLNHQEPYIEGKMVYHGHTPEKNIAKMFQSNRINLDGGFVYGYNNLILAFDTDKNKKFPIEYSIVKHNDETFTYEYEE